MRITALPHYIAPSRSTMRAKYIHSTRPVVFAISYVRRLKYHAPDAKINIYMGRGKTTFRIHFHMISEGVSEKLIRDLWGLGDVLRIEHLREHNYYNGVDYGRDYTGLANYLFDHWTPEQGGHRWKQTKNLKRPEREEPTVVKRNYSATRPLARRKAMF